MLVRVFTILVLFVPGQYDEYGNSVTSYSAVYATQENCEADKGNWVKEAHRRYGKKIDKVLVGADCRFHLPYDWPTDWSRYVYHGRGRPNEIFIDGQGVFALDEKGNPTRQLSSDPLTPADEKAIEDAVRRAIPRAFEWGKNPFRSTK